MPGRPLARSWANFTNVFRAEVGKEQYTDLPLPVVPRRLREASGSHRVPGLFPEIIGLLLEDVEEAEYRLALRRGMEFTRE